jgi:flavorubredoxin
MVNLSFVFSKFSIHPETLYGNLEEIGTDPKDIDYLIVNHMEPDHSGWIENFEKTNDKFTKIFWIIWLIP